MPVASAPAPRRFATTVVRLESAGATAARLAPWHPACKARGVATINQRSPGSALDAMPTGELMRQVLDETKELVRIEVRLARDELEADLRQMKRAAIFAGVALVLAILALSMLLMAILFAFGASSGGALALAGVLLLGGGACAALAFRRVPKQPLARTRERLKHDVSELEEHLQ